MEKLTIEKTNQAGTPTQVQRPLLFLSQPAVIAILSALIMSLEIGAADGLEVKGRFYADLSKKESRGKWSDCHLLTLPN